ncbi:MAG TPA: hypothetical protein VMM92_16520, partial [Thermoanaerobaculia bacterium]|nr:hypothetical protein [Thermoanaerobaculia bacterium]
RALLGARARSFPEVKLFISISTPWGGERLTDHAPPLIPSWRDLRPEGAFLKTLFRERLPADLEYDLLFGYRGARGLLRPNNDGTVTLESALRMAAQAEARRIYGFDESHAGILSSPQVVEVLNALFAEAERR